MKRIFSLLLIYLIFACLSGCSNNEDSFGFQPPIPGIKWGMTPDEVVKELNLKEDNIHNNDSNIITLSYEDTSIFNQKADLILDFDMQSEIGLVRIRADFPNLNKDDLIIQLTNTYGKNVAVDDNWVPCQWESKKVVDLPTKIQDRFKYIKVELPTIVNGTNGLFSNDTTWKNILDEPLVKVSIIDDKLVYTATNMAAYTAFKDDDKYNKMVETINSWIEDK